jgi:hypothetical protein
MATNFLCLLTFVLSSAKLDATSHRWIAALSAYDFEIVYKSGKQNQDCDGLSRRPQLFSDAVKAVCFVASVSLSSAECCSGDEVPNMANEESFPSEAAVRPVLWAVEQSKDTDIFSVFSILRSGSCPRGGDVDRRLISSS